jgi:metallo-beta-lactamase family protein
MSVKIKFVGASGTVTGSCYLVSSQNTKFLVDCGMYQGPVVEARNLEEFPFNPAEVDFVLVTHTHIDHIGLLPKLVRHGFQGKIYCTYHTAQLAEILLYDSAKIQENNFKAGVPWKHAGEVALIYDTKDVDETVQRFEVVEFGEQFNPASDVQVTYVPAGHVLGAASLHVVVEDTKIAFSGDIGRVKQDLIPSFPETTDFQPDYILMESLYGGEEHPARHESVDELTRLVRETVKNGGSVFIPSFAVQRTQELLNDFKIAKQSGALPKDLQVILDSPMAQRVTSVYAAALDHTGDSLFNFDGLKYIRNSKKSAKYSRKTGQVTIAGSGMADGGRIVSHLAANIGNPKNTVAFVGYQAEATLGRELVEGAKDVIIDKMMFKVKAQIVQLGGFSAHGDTNDYLAWLKRYPTNNIKKIFLIHAESARAQAMQQVLAEQGINQSHIPDREEVVNL